MNIQKFKSSDKFNIGKLLNEHPVISTIFLSILASILYALFVEPIIDGFQNLKLLEINIGYNLQSNDTVSFQLNLIKVLFCIICVLCLVIYITYINVRKKIKKNIKESLPNEFYCDKCEEVESLTEEILEKQKQYDNLLQEYQHALPYKKLTDCLSDFFDNTEVLESLQLFTTPKLPSIEESNTLEEINVPLHFVDGKAKEFSNTNALFNINYKFDKSIYHDVKKLFDLRNEYYSTKSKQRNPNTEKDIQDNARVLFDRLKDDLDKINDIGEIKSTHFATYKLLEILANVVIGEKSVVQCKQLLKSHDIENQLKYGQRTGMLGAIFTESLYCFYNENSMTKKDRMYFSVPIVYKQQQFILLGICNKNDLKVTKSCDYVKCCEEIYEKVNEALCKIGGAE